MSMQNLNCILLIEDAVKKELSINLASLTLYGITILNDISEASRRLLETKKKVIILGFFNYNSLGRLRLYQQTWDLELYLISDDSLLINAMKNFAKCFTLDYRTLDSNLIYSILYDDKMAQSKFLVNLDQDLLAEKATTLLQNTTSNSVKSVCESYLCLRSVLQQLTEYSDQLSEVNQSLQTEIDAKESSYKLCNEAYTELIEQTLEQEKVLRKYRFMLTKDVYDKVNISNYKRHPIILYFKEYEEMIYLQSFLDTLCAAFKVQGKFSVKLIHLFDSVDQVRVETIKHHYDCVISNSFLQSEVISNNKILSIGNYKQLFDLLLTNKFPLDLLIVVDSKKFNDVTLAGPDINYYTIVRKLSTAKLLGLDSKFSVNNDAVSSINLLSWGFFKEWDVLKNPDSRLEFFTSRPVIKYFYETITTILDNSRR